MALKAWLKLIAGEALGDGLGVGSARVLVALNSV